MFSPLLPLIPMKAVELFRTKEAYGERFVETVIWRVPSPVPPSQHPYKYRLVYVVDGERRVGYDNERGKGDHKHIGNHKRHRIALSIPNN